jgi:ankyrin repeat protein
MFNGQNGRSNIAAEIREQLLQSAPSKTGFGLSALQNNYSRCGVGISLQPTSTKISQEHVAMNSSSSNKKVSQQRPAQPQLSAVLPRTKSTEHNQTELEKIASRKDELDAAYQRIRLEVKKWHEKINILNDQGFTLLSWLVKTGDLENIKKLISYSEFGPKKQQNLEINKSNSDGTNPLILSLSSTVEIMQVILSLKPDLNFLYQDQTALMIAILNHSDKIALLFNYGVDVNFQNQQKQTALHISVLHKKLSSIDDLLVCGADTNLYDANNKTPLFLAAEMGKSGFEMVLKFLNLKVKFTREDLDSLEEPTFVKDILTKILKLDECQDRPELVKLLNDKTEFQLFESYMTIIDIAKKRYGVSEEEVEFIVSTPKISLKQYGYYLVLNNDLVKKITKLSYISISEDNEFQEIFVHDHVFSDDCSNFLDAMIGYKATEGVGVKKLKISNLQEAFGVFFTSIIKSSLEEAVKQCRSPDFVIISSNYLIMPGNLEKVFLSDLSIFSEEKCLSIVDSFDFSKSQEVKHLEDLGHESNKLCISSQSKSILDSELALLVHWAGKNDENGYPFDFGIRTYLHDAEDLW